MPNNNAPQIKSIDIAKQNRFWTVKTDGKLLAICLYKQGAAAVQELIQRLAGLPVTAELEQPAKVAKPAEKTETKPAAKGGDKAKEVKAKPPQQKSHGKKPADVSIPAPAAQ